MNKEQTIGHYPFSKYEAPTKVHAEFGRHLGELLKFPIFTHLDKTKIFDLVSAHFQAAEALFEPEEIARRQGKPNANLFYHGKDHAVYQASYDAITTAQAILNHSKVAQYLTPEGVLSILISATHHDDGYVFETFEDTYYVSRRPIHVAESIRAAQYFLEAILIPPGLSPTKLKSLVPIGIHATNFPFGDIQKLERKNIIKDLDARDKKEALIIALSVQLADLGGQVARHDYLNNLYDLRRELNGEREGLGDETIGLNHEMGEKRKAFIEEVIQKGVGKTARAFFGTEENTFAVQWEKHLKDC